MSKTTMELYDVQVEDNMDGGLTIKVNISSPNVVYRFVAPHSKSKLDVMGPEDIAEIYGKRVASEYTQRIFQTVRDAVNKHLNKQEG